MSNLVNTADLVCVDYSTFNKIITRIEGELGVEHIQKHVTSDFGEGILVDEWSEEWIYKTGPDTHVELAFQHGYTYVEDLEELEAYQFVNDIFLDPHMDLITFNAIVQIMIDREDLV